MYFTVVHSNPDYKQYGQNQNQYADQQKQYTQQPPVDYGQQKQYNHNDSIYGSQHDYGQRIPTGDGHVGDFHFGEGGGLDNSSFGGDDEGSKTFLHNDFAFDEVDESKYGANNYHYGEDGFDNHRSTYYDEDHDRRGYEDYYGHRGPEFSDDWQNYL